MFGYILPRYRICRSHPKKVYKNPEEFQNDTERTIADAISKCSLYQKCDSLKIDKRCRIYKIDPNNNTAVLISPGLILLSSNNTRTIDFVLATYGWKSLSTSQQLAIINYGPFQKDCKNILKTFLNDVHEHDKKLFEQHPRLMLYKHRKHLVDDNHWIWSAIDNIYLPDERHKVLRQALDYSTYVPKSNPISGYKAFIKNDDGTLQCRDYVFDVTKNHKTNLVIPCGVGFHFCKKKNDIAFYYNFSSPNVVIHKVNAWGTVVEDGDKMACNNLQILEQVNKYNHF